MKNNFKVGDVVRLKSGGKSMTIHEIQDGDRLGFVVCSWFECQGGYGLLWSMSGESFTSRSFPIDMLEIVPTK